MGEEVGRSGGSGQAEHLVLGHSGVHCRARRGDQGSDSHLVELDLRSNALVDLPDELAELRSLKVVRLNYNKLEHLPKVLTRLKRMTRLEMGGCLLREVDETVGSLPGSLRDLDLSGNRIQTVHPAMAELRKLTYLNLENNMLVGLPEEMGEMENLSVLDLSNNQLATLPDTFGGLRGLTRIEVNNKLTMLPPSMGHLTNLKDFDCRYNELKEPGKSKADGPVAVFLGVSPERGGAAAAGGD